MPRIPTFTAEQSIRTGSTGPQADVPSFTAPYEALQRVGQGLMNLGDSLVNIDQRRRQLVDTQWAQERLFAFNNELAAYQADEKRNMSDAYADEFKAFAERRLTEYQKAAPSTRASQAFRAAALSRIGARYESALRTMGDTRRDNAFIALEKNTADVLAAYRSDAGAHGVEALDLLQQNVEQLHRGVEVQWRFIPKLADKLHEVVAQQIVLGVATENPEWARAYLDSLKIDEVTRNRLTNAIEEAERSGKQLNQFYFGRDLQKKIENAELQGGLVADVPLATFQQMYGSELGEKKKAEFDDSRTAVNQASTFAAKVEGSNEAAIRRELGKISTDTSYGQSAQLAISQKAKQLIEAQQRDPVAYLQAYSPEVRAAYSLLALAPQDRRVEYENRAAEIALHFQGHAAPDDPEADKHLGLPTRSRSILTVAQATQQAAQLNQGAPSEQLAEIARLKALYGPEHFAIALNDMVRLPKKGEGIPPEAQIAFLNSERTWAAEYLGVLRNPEVIKSLSPERASEFDNILFANQTWNRFATALYGSAWQRIDEAGAWARGIVIYAHSLAARGRKPEDAIKLSVERLISSELALPTVHGQPLIVMKRRQDGTYRTDDEIEDYGRRLEIALRDIDPREIKLEDDNGVPYFLSLPLLPDDDPATMQHLRDIVTSQGWFMAEPDGQSVSLYLFDDDGVAFQVRDKANQPFEIALDDLPEFWMSVPITERSVFENAKVGATDRIPEKPKPVYDMQTRRRVMGPGNDLRRTNWPSTGEYYKGRNRFKGYNSKELQPQP